MKGTVMLTFVATIIFSASASWAVAAAADIGQQLDSKDPTQIAQALVSIQQQLQSADLHDRRSAVLGLDRKGHWLKKLMDAGRYDDINTLTVSATVALPSDVSLIEYLQWYRMQALLKLNKPQEALGVAKGLFNVSRQKNTANALGLVVDCLKAANPSDHTIIDRLREEQTTGSVLPTSHAEKEIASQSSALSPRSSVLDTIKVDGSPYAAAIQQLSEATDYLNLLSLGNLLLLSDRPREARVAFEQAYAMATEKKLPEASESIARCIRAEDGTIGRANAWVMAIRPQVQH